MEKITNVYKICIGVLKKKCKCKWEGDIKMDLQELGCEMDLSG
jgi:hypothetical protein